MAVGLPFQAVQICRKFVENAEVFDCNRPIGQPGHAQCHFQHFAQPLDLACVPTGQILIAESAHCSAQLRQAACTAHFESPQLARGNTGGPHGFVHVGNRAFQLRRQKTVHQPAHGFGIGIELGVERIARGKSLHDGRLARI